MQNEMANLAKMQENIAKQADKMSLPDPAVDAFKAAQDLKNRRHRQGPGEPGEGAGQAARRHKKPQPNVAELPTEPKASPKLAKPSRAQAKDNNRKSRRDEGAIRHQPADNKEWKNGRKKANQAKAGAAKIGKRKQGDNPRSGQGQQAQAGEAKAARPRPAKDKPTKPATAKAGEAKAEPKEGQAKRSGKRRRPRQSSGQDGQMKTPAGQARARIQAAQAKSGDAKQGQAKKAQAQAGQAKAGQGARRRPKAAMPIAIDGQPDDAQAKAARKHPTAAGAERRRTCRLQKEVMEATKAHEAIAKRHRSRHGRPRPGAGSGAESGPKTITKGQPTTGKGQPKLAKRPAWPGRRETGPGRQGIGRRSQVHELPLSKTRPARRRAKANNRAKHWPWATTGDGKDGQDKMASKAARERGKGKDGKVKDGKGKDGQAKGKKDGQPKDGQAKKNDNYNNKGEGNRVADGKTDNPASRFVEVNGDGSFLHLPPRQRELIQQALSGNSLLSTPR